MKKAHRTKHVLLGREEPAKEESEIYCERVISLRLYYSFAVGSITAQNIAQQWTLTRFDVD